MFDFLDALIGLIVGTGVTYFLSKPKKVGTLLFHNPESMIAELDQPVEEIYKRDRVMFIVSRR